MNRIWFWAVVIIIVLGGGYWLLGHHGAPMPSETGTAATQSVTTSMETASSTQAATSTTVSYDGQVFTPATVTIKQGGTVTFTDTNGTMWVASDPHPMHTGYDGTSRAQHCAAGYTGPAPFDQCAPGASYSFTFDKVGTWGYHDHINHSAVGTVIVVQ